MPYLSRRIYTPSTAPKEHMTAPYSIATLSLFFPYNHTADNKPVLAHSTQRKNAIYHCSKPFCQVNTSSNYDSDTDKRHTHSRQNPSPN